MRALVLVATAAVIAVSGCGASDPKPPTSSAVDTKASSPTSAPPKDLGSITDTGFGQRDQYVWVTAIVHNNSQYVGQTVTVNFNLLDGQGKLLKSASQVESFSQPNADHAVGTQVDLGAGEKAAKIEATLDVEASGAFSDEPFPKMPTSPVVVAKGEYGNVVASFELSNPLAVAIKNPRVGVVCRDKGGAIVGGTSTYPELVPSHGKIKVDADVTTTGMPSACEVYVGAPPDWEGDGATPSITTAAASGSPEQAFKTWVEQFNDKDWAAQYSTLVSAQQKVVSEDEYAACRSRVTAPKFMWDKVLSVTDAGVTAIPGTSVKLASTKVTVRLVVAGVKTPVDAHMFQEDGKWKWSMTKQNIQGCTS